MVAEPRGVLRKVSWNVVDQGLSALSNVLLAILVARSVDANAFGSFAVAFAIFGIAVAVAKSLVGTPLQMSVSSAPAPVQRQQTEWALGCALLLGLVGSAGCAIAAIATGGVLSAALAALTVVLPALVVQDSCRMAMFMAGRADRAALIDGVWVVAQFGLLAILLALGHATVPAMIVVWGGAAALSAITAMILLRARPLVGRATAWLRSQADLIRFLLPEYFLGLGAAQLTLLLIGAVVSTSAVGAIRAVQVLLGPLGVLGSAALQFAIPEIARQQDRPNPRLRTFGMAVGGSLGLVTLMYVAVLLVLPAQVGSALFGDSWANAAAVLLPIGLSSVASSFANGPAGVLYGLGQARTSFRINLVKGPVLVVTVLVLAAQLGVVGAAWTMCLIEVAVLPFWVAAFLRASARARAGMPTPLKPSSLTS